MGLGTFSIFSGLIMTAGIYIITCLSFYFLFRKAGYRNKWMAFVPVLSTYKQFCFAYDYFKGGKVLNGTITAAKYQDIRRNLVSSATVGYIILLFVGTLIMTLLLEGNGVALNDNYMEMITNIIGLIFTSVLSIFILRNFINKDTGEKVLPLTIFMLIVLGFVTFNLSWIAVYFYFGLNEKHYYTFHA